MELVFSFIKAEDKFWGLFLVSLFFLYVVHLDKKEKNAEKYLWIVLYGFVAYLVFLCPLTYRILTPSVFDMSTYYQVGYIEILTPILTIAAAVAVLREWKNGKKSVISLVVGFFVILMIIGNLGYLPLNSESTTYGCSEEEKEAFDLILNHAKEMDDREEIRIWGEEEWMAKSRMYDASFMPVYGKDIDVNPDKYSESLNVMYASYAKYNAFDNSGNNIKDQLDALASMPYLYPEVDCEYMVIYKPEKQFADREAGIPMEDDEAIEGISRFHYEMVGTTDNWLIFYKKEN